MSFNFSPMTSTVFADYAEDVTLFGSAARAIVNRSAEVMVGAILELRVTVEFLLSEADPQKGQPLRIGDKSYVLDQAIRRDDLTVVWILEEAD